MLLQGGLDEAMRRILAVLLTLAPFVAGAIAALGRRHDSRMLWMALAATLVARLVLALTGGRGRTGAAIGAFAAATVVACAAAVLLGARAVFGVVAVAVVLSGCATAGAALWPRPASVA
jgi:hypothetical protein